MTVGDLIYILQKESVNYHDEVMLKVGEDETGRELHVANFIVKQKQDKNINFLSIEKPDYIKERIINLEEREEIIRKTIDEEVKKKQEYEKDERKVESFKENLEELYKGL